MKTELEDRIKNTRLTKTEKRIADYLLEHSGSLYFTTARDLAAELNVSDTSVIRLCRSLGYKGYKDLQESLREELSSRLEQEKYVVPMDQVGEKHSRYRQLSSYQCLEMAVANLQTTYKRNEPEKFSRAAELILASEHVFIAGFRGSATTAMHLGLLLSQYIEGVRYFSRADSNCVEAMLDCGAEDCVILAGVERYSKMTKVLAEMAREAGCRLIVLTDKITAGIAADADIVFLSEYASPTAMNSFLGAMYVVETIAFEVSRKLGVRPRVRLQRLNRYLSELQLY